MAQDDYYYEIQLTNKQLVFYFLAGSAALVLSFLAGVKVGRGVEETASADASGVRRVVEDRIVPEEPPPTRPPQAAEDLTYAQRLEGDKVEDALEKPGAAEGKQVSKALPTPKPAEAKPPVTAAAPLVTAVPKPAASTTPAPKPAPPKAALPTPAAPTAPGTFTIQVGAFKDRGTAESVVARLKGKGYAAYVVAPDGPEGGLFNVRVGTYPARTDAERAQTKLRDEEKYKPFIVRN
ncbi:MAG TPA: SPOR domain-containing protein [Vicinamibacteria bacterium]|nr:SPOR domain-containing protein [Vicinamibacteria bacterium]